MHYEQHAVLIQCLTEITGVGFYALSAFVVNRDDSRWFVPPFGRVTVSLSGYSALTLVL